MANGNAMRVLRFGLLAALSAPLCVAQDTAPMGGGAPGVSAVPMPAPQSEMSQAPPNPPKVSCKGDQLSVIADNSTLSSVLVAVRNCTGVKIDIPEGAAQVRTFDQLGPGPARDVLTELLSGTDFNYVIESSLANPEKIEAVLVIAHVSDKPPGTLPEHVVMTPGRRAWLGTQKNGRATYTGSNSEDETPATEGIQNVQSVDDSGAPIIDNPGATAVPPPAAAGDSSTPAVPVAEAAPEANPNSTPAADKGTEDKITSMQQLFEQRKQMIENQQNPAAAKPQ